MVVEFQWKKEPSYRVASIVRIGPYQEDNLKAEFRELCAWTKKNHVRTGRWIFFERSHTRWEACLEVKGNAEPEGRIRLKTLPATKVARIVFDPDQVSSRIVYHGLLDWTRQRRRDGEIRSVTAIREVYDGDPWNNPKAWAKAEVQFLVRP